MNLIQSLREKFGNEVRLSNNLGIIQKRQGDVDAAISSYKAAIDQDETSFFPNYNLAVVLAGEGRFDEAILYFKHSLTIAEAIPQQANYQSNVLLNLAVSYESLKKLERAVDSLEKALRLDPSNKEIQKKLQSLKQLI